MKKSKQTPEGWKWNPPAPVEAANETFHTPPLVQSATECTGLMPKVPDTKSEAVAYSRLYGIHCAKPRRRHSEHAHIESP